MGKKETIILANAEINDKKEQKESVSVPTKARTTEENVQEEKKKHAIAIPKQEKPMKEKRELSSAEIKSKEEAKTNEKAAVEKIELVTSNQENQNKNEKSHEQNEEHDVPAIDSKDRKLKSNAEKPVTEKAAEKDEKKVLVPETLVEEQAVKEIKDAVTITKKEDISKEEAIEKKDPKAIEVPQAQDVKNKDSSLIKEKKMKMVKKKKKKGTTSDTTDTIQFEQIIDTKPEEPEPYIVDEPDSLSEDSSKEIVHTNEKLQIAEEIPKTTHDSTIVSIPSDQKEVEELPIITVTHDKAYVAEEIPVTTLDN